MNTETLQVFKQTGAILEGHFRLSSGLHSAQYLQCALVLQHPEYAKNLCLKLAKKFTQPLRAGAGFKKNKPNVVMAPAIGGIIVSHEVAGALGAKSVFTERVNGEMTLRRGFSLNKNDRVLVVEDVVTTGLSTSEVINVVKEHGAKLIGVGCIVDRSSKKMDFGARFERLLKIDIPTFKPEACPLCKDKIPVTKPGSRK